MPRRSDRERELGWRSLQRSRSLTKRRSGTDREVVGGGLELRPCLSSTRAHGRQHVFRSLQLGMVRRRRLVGPQRRSPRGFLQGPLQRGRLERARRALVRDRSLSRPREIGRGEGEGPDEREREKEERRCVG